MKMIIESTVAGLGLLSLYLIKVVFNIHLDISSMLDRIVSPFAKSHEKKRSLKGIWECAYKYFDDDEELTAKELISIKYRGKSIIGKSIRNSVSDNDYKFEGRLSPSNIFTGIWEDMREDCLYGGAFQLVISPGAKEMKGKWIGFYENYEIYDGPWALSFMDSSLSRKRIEQIASTWNISPELIDYCNSAKTKNI